jgi:multidrug efflux pump subunit AcrA (membrane-fusion protein)
MVANVSLTPINDDEDHYTVPITAVQKKADGSLFVWVVDNDNKACRKAVIIGETVGNKVFITQGINGGDRIVTEGYQKLSEGTKVVY